jgi:ubiquitin-conjugating enzyme E2 Q
MKTLFSLFSSFSLFELRLLLLLSYCNSLILSTTTTMDVSTDNSVKKVAPQQSMQVPPDLHPQQITLCVSHGADVVDPAGSPLVANADDDAVIAAPEPTNEGRTSLNDSNQIPAEIPPEESKAWNEEEEDDDDDDSSEYSYEDDDDAAFSGFLSAPAAALNMEFATSSPARIVEEETVVTSSTAATEAAELKKKWKEPSRAAVSMSLRAQQETSGSKRRLAQDLYRIMNQDTEEAGFSLAPQSEDCMDKWTIKLFQFDEDSNLAKDMLVLCQDHIQLEMKFPNQYPFEPPFVRVVKPRFKRQTGFVMNGALCMELLTKDGWNPINDIESVIVSIRSLLVVGDGRLQAATELSDSRYEALLKAATGKDAEESEAKRQKLASGKHASHAKPVAKSEIGTYTDSEAQAAYSHLSDYHKKKGWDTSGWWARKG